MEKQMHQLFALKCSQSHFFILSQLFLLQLARATLASYKLVLKLCQFKIMRLRVTPGSAGAVARKQANNSPLLYLKALRFIIETIKHKTAESYSHCCQILNIKSKFVNWTNCGVTCIRSPLFCVLFMTTAASFALLIVSLSVYK